MSVNNVVEGAFVRDVAWNDCFDLACSPMNITVGDTLNFVYSEAHDVVKVADAAAEEAKDAVTCQICYANRRNALVMPCCHLLYCYRCVTRASEVAEARGHPDRCPCCRGPISGVLRCKLTE